MKLVLLINVYGFGVFSMDYFLLQGLFPEALFNELSVQKATIERIFLPFFLLVANFFSVRILRSSSEEMLNHLPKNPTLLYLIPSLILFFLLVTIDLSASFKNIGGNLILLSIGYLIFCLNATLLDIVIVTISEKKIATFIIQILFILFSYVLLMVVYPNATLYFYIWPLFFFFTYLFLIKKIYMFKEIQKKPEINKKNYER